MIGCTTEDSGGSIPAVKRALKIFAISVCQGSVFAGDMAFSDTHSPTAPLNRAAVDKLLNAIVIGETAERVVETQDNELVPVDVIVYVAGGWLLGNMVKSSLFPPVL